MEKAILKTLTYADIFDYSLKAWEIHKWLIGKKITLRQVERALNKLSKKSKVKSKKDFYFLKSRKGLVKKRLQREKDSAKLIKQAVWVANLLKIVPTIKLVGISGNLAMENAKLGDDIDFFIITQKGRIWISRILILFLLSLIGKRRERGDKKAAGKICVNLLLEEDQLFQKNKDLYTAHEVLQMRVLWQRDNVYSRFLEENEWVFKFLPNWTSGVRIEGVKEENAHRRRNAVDQKNARHSHARKSNSLRSDRDSLRVRTSSHTANLFEGVINFAESSSRFLQLRYMGEVSGKERVSETALYFHPNDYREKILKKYQISLENRA